MRAPGWCFTSVLPVVFALTAACGGTVGATATSETGSADSEGSDTAADVVVGPDVLDSGADFGDDVIAPLDGGDCGGLLCGSDNVSCCTRLLVAGGAFQEESTIATPNPTLPARVSTFVLDEFEVSVGRFRRFVDRYPESLPAVGGGSFKGRPATGWQSTNPVAMTAADLRADLASFCNYGDHAWTDAAGTQERLPMNCVTYWEAFAFCAWSGGRLPTRAELDRVALGGEEQRNYPWSVPPSDTTLDHEHASYLDDDAGTDATLPPPVGMLAKGAGRWRHRDSVGGVQEWALDGCPFPPGVGCDDCIVEQPTASSICATVYGGSALNFSSYVTSPEMRFEGRGPSTRYADVGLRCAYDVP